MSKIKELQQMYPMGALFYSATGNIKSPLVIAGEIKEHRELKGTYIVSSGGVLFDGETKTYAKCLHK